MFHRIVLLSEGKVNKMHAQNRASESYLSEWCVYYLHFFPKVAYHGVPEKAYEIFVNALQSSDLRKRLDIPDLGDHNPAG